MLFSTTGSIYHHHIKKISQKQFCGKRIMEKNCGRVRLNPAACQGGTLGFFCKPILIKIPIDFPTRPKGHYFPIINGIRMRNLEWFVC